MRYKTLFRVLMKVLGVWFLIQGGIGVLSIIAQVLFVYQQGLPPQAGGMWPYSVLATSGELIKLGAGVYLFFGGRWLADKAIPSNRPYCPECGYDLHQSSESKCPECGMVLGAEADP